MSQLILEIPADLADALQLPAGEKPRRLRRELAVRLYEKGLLAFGKCRRLAGMSKWDFHGLLADEGIVRRYDQEELEEDLQTLGELD